MKTRLLITLFTMTFLFNCSNDDDNIQDTGFDGSIEDIKEFYNDDLVAALEDLGFIINTGNTPPGLEGTFLISQYILEASTVPNDVIGRAFSDNLITFSNQNNETLTIDYVGVNGNQTDNGSGSFISGNGNQFSVFLKLTSQIGSTPVETAYAISGETAENGIENIQVVLLMLDDKGDPEEVYIANNTGRLFSDSNNFSTKQ